MALLKRSEGIVNLVVMSLKKEEPEDDKKGGDGDKAGEKKKEEKPKEPEKPIDPATCEVELNRKTLIEVKAEKKPLGVIVVGGKNNYVKVKLTEVKLILNLYSSKIPTIVSSKMHIHFHHH